MIIPSIDITDGKAVQLVGGEHLVLEAGDPRPLLERFSMVGEVAVVDIDAARGDGHNRDLIIELAQQAPIRVGGGIRDVKTAVGWLDVGVEQVMIGTAAKRGLLEELPRDRVIVALDSVDGRVVTHGWRHDTGTDLIAAIEELRDLCGGFLLTFVEREGRLGGTNLERARQAIDAAGDARVTIAGGITSPEEIAALDRLDADAQVGMALYTGRFDLATGFAAPLVSDRDDGLWPTVVVDEHGVALGLAWSSLDSLSRALETRRGVYHSRSRGLWVKGETSGAEQELMRISVDCDRDVLRFTVRQADPGFCHLGTRSCWGHDSGLTRLFRRLETIATNPPEASNTRRLLEDPALLGAKLAEEAAELSATSDPAQVASEAADLLYFTVVKAISAGVGLEDIETILDGRERRITRRPLTAGRQS